MEDADTELLESARHNRVVEEDREDDYADTWGVLFDAGLMLASTVFRSMKHAQHLGKRDGSAWI